MFLFKRMHNFWAGYAVAIVSTVLLIIGAGMLSALFNRGFVTDLAIAALFYAIGLVTLESEKRGILTANSYISIIGKGFCVAGFMVVFYILDDYPWYIQLVLSGVVIFIPYTLYPNNFVWAKEPDGNESAGANSAA